MTVVDVFSFESYFMLAVLVALIAVKVFAFVSSLLFSTESYRAAGGECQYEVFSGCEHLWIDEPGPQTDRAHEMVKAFIARQLKAKRLAA